MDIKLIKGDNGIGYLATLSNEDGPVDLTDVDILFLFGKHEIRPIKEAETGKVLLVFESLHTDKTGYYRSTFKVRFKDGRLESFPGVNEDRIKVIIKER